MKELHRKELATYPGPESCICSRKAVGEALTGENAGQPLSYEIHTTRAPTLLSEAESNISDGNISKSSKTSAQSETLSMHGHSLPGNREILEMSDDKSDCLGKVLVHKPNMYVQ